MSAAETFKRMNLDRTSISCQANRSFAAPCFRVKRETFDTFEYIIH